MDILKLLKDSIAYFNLDTTYLRDLAFAICISDKLRGTNNIELDVDKFVESDVELSWNAILCELNITPQNRGCTKLPRVQKLRIISDILSLALQDKVSDLSLSCKASKDIKNLGVNLPYEDYADEDSCYKNLSKIESALRVSNLDLGNFAKLYNRLCIYTKRIEQIGVVNLPTEFNTFLIADSIYNNLGKSCSIEDLSKFLEDKKLTIDDYANYIIDNYCFYLVQKVMVALNNIYKQNEVKFNLIVTRIDKYARAYLPIGLYSMNNYTYRISGFRNISCYLNRKVNLVFSENSPFSETTILGCIVMLYFIQRAVVKEEYIVSQMEELVNECKDNE